MSDDWLENLKRYALSDGINHRLTWEEAEIAVEEIERLREELNVTRLQRDAKLSSQTAVDEAAAREIERLRTALERISEWENNGKTYCRWCGSDASYLAQELTAIALEALSDE